MSGMRKISKATVKRVNAELADAELELLRRTTVDLQALRPQVTDKETYDKLMAAVAESTRKNESIAQLKSRLQSLGEAGVAVVKRAVELASKAT